MGHPVGQSRGRGKDDLADNEAEKGRLVIVRGCWATNENLAARYRAFSRLNVTEGLWCGRLLPL